MTGRSFGGCLRYVLNRLEATILETEGVGDSSTEAMIRDFNTQRKLNPALGKAVGHLVLSWHKEDGNMLISQVMADRAKEFMKLMEIRDTQYAIVQHTDRNNPHVHVVYNRVDNNGKTISDQNNYKRNEKACKALTEKYGYYYYGQGKEQVNRGRLKGKEQLRYQLFDAISSAAKTAKNWQQLEAMLKQQGIGLEYKFKSGSTTNVQGVSFSKEQLKIKGSAIDRTLSYTNLDKRLRQNNKLSQLQAQRDYSPFQQDASKREKETATEKEYETETAYYNGEPGATAPDTPAPGETASVNHEQSETFSWLESMQELSNASGSAHDVDDDAMRRKRRSRSR